MIEVCLMTHTALQCVFALSEVDSDHLQSGRAMTRSHNT